MQRVISSSRGYLGIDDGGFLVRFQWVRNRRGIYPRRLGPMDDPRTGDLVPEWLRPDHRELLDWWQDGWTVERYRDEVRQTYDRRQS